MQVETRKIRAANRENENEVNAVLENAEVSKKFGIGNEDSIGEFELNEEEES